MKRTYCLATVLTVFFAFIACSANAISPDRESGSFDFRVTAGASPFYYECMADYPDEGSFSYSISFSGDSQNLQLGLVDEHGREISCTVNSSHQQGVLRHIPAGTYRIFVCCPSYENQAGTEAIGCLQFTLDSSGYSHSIVS